MLERQKLFPSLQRKATNRSHVKVQKVTHQITFIFIKVLEIVMKGQKIYLFLDRHEMADEQSLVQTKIKLNVKDKLRRRIIRIFFLYCCIL